MSNESQLDDLNENQKAFCREYVKHWNATRAYMKAYPKSSRAAARSSAPVLLANPSIEPYIKEVQARLERQLGMTKTKVVQEWMKIGFSTIADLHNTWIDLKDFEKIPKKVRACIQEIQTRSIKVKTERTIDGNENQVETDIETYVEQVKIKLYDKTKALENISKLLGYNEPEKYDVDNHIDIAPIKWIGDE